MAMHDPLKTRLGKILRRLVIFFKYLVEIILFEAQALFKLTGTHYLKVE